MTRPERFSPSKRLRSIACALRGLRRMIRTQHNAWIHLAATVVAIILGLALGVGRLEWCVIVLAIVLVWAAEALNTALEILCDVASPEFHPLIEKSKDVAAGGVLVAAAGALAIGIFIFGPRVLAVLQGA